jgi:hypothetical protein
MNNGGGQGAGLINNGGATATVTDCLFQGNLANQGGGIMNFFDATVTLIRTRVTGNFARASGSYLGSGVYNYRGTAHLQDHTFVCANNPTEEQCFGVSTVDETSGCPEVCPEP